MMCKSVVVLLSAPSIHWKSQTQLLNAFQDKFLFLTSRGRKKKEHKGLNVFTLSKNCKAMCSSDPVQNCAIYTYLLVVYSGCSEYANYLK